MDSGFGSGLVSSHHTILNYREKIKPNQTTDALKRNYRTITRKKREKTLIKKDANFKTKGDRCRRNEDKKRNGMTAPQRKDLKTHSGPNKVHFSFNLNMDLHLQFFRIFSFTYFHY